MGQTSDRTVKGGSFLIEDAAADSFTPEDFTDEQKMIAKLTADFTVNEVVPLLDKIEQHEFSHTIQLLKQAGELGLLGADIPEEYGGLGLDKISSTLIAEKLARGGSFALSHGAHVGIGSLPIVFFGNEQQKKKYLPSLATGERIAAYALTEPSSGSDALSAKTTAVLNEAGTHYVVNGEKQWITNSAFADLFIVYAQIDGKAFSAFIVERDFEGVKTGIEEKKMGIKGSSTRTVILENAQVPKENLLGEAGKGHLIAFNILNIGRFKLGVGCVGSAKRAIELAAGYANERKQFNTPIGQFRLIQEKLAEMAVATYATESAVYRTGGLIEQRFGSLTEEEQKSGRAVAGAIAEYAIECSLNKIAGSELLDFVVDEAVQIHGGYGYMAEYEVERMYRDSRINRIFEGTNEINRLIVPGTLLRKAMKGELPLLEKAGALQEELVQLLPAEVGSGPLEQEKQLLSMAKKIFLFVAGLGVRTYGEALQQEQELLANVADIVNDIYQMESAILRTEKARSGANDKGDRKLIMTQIFCQEAFQRIEANAKESLIMMEEGDQRRMLLGILRKLTRHEAIDVVKKKRLIAAAVLEESGYIS
ncbi:acyl-CoA dehydrogenase family protein [Alkalihalobacillus oceani]|uniref:Acyl-CoA dehydrogenase family protein n=1 Tax=Halalkalibacter oceani TaxID=1653776 RepID=A0A9X2IN25_9BACI|nr:acyl-CoA dehydrogenase family protein [Halalkalibacter oceani]MCM3714499.1 acyl-CoA dehydrogenase family protein [Halalkalibacter oceani]